MKDSAVKCETNLPTYDNDLMTKPDAEGKNSYD